MAQPPPHTAHDGSGVKAAVNQQFSPVAAHYSASPIHASGPDLAEMVVERPPLRTLRQGPREAGHARTEAPLFSSIPAWSLVGCEVRPVM